MKNNDYCAFSALFSGGPGPSHRSGGSSSKRDVSMMACFNSEGLTVPEAKTYARLLGDDFLLSWEQSTYYYCPSTVGTYSASCPITKAVLYLSFSPASSADDGTIKVQHQVLNITVTVVL